MQRNLLFVATILLLIFSCSKVPITGRQQMNLLPEEDLRQMSEHQYDSLMKAWPLIKSGKDYNQVVNVGSKIANAAENYLRNNGYTQMADGFDWEYNLVDNDTVANAWCMPGGKIAFYSGILPITHTENGLAVVMAHEISHAVAQHGNERMSQGMALQLGGMALSVALQTNTRQTQQLFMSAYGLGAQLGVMLPYSRKHELEADEMGLIFMAMAGYDPREAVDFWSRMENNDMGVVTPTFFSTHPATQTRIDSIQSNMPQALKYYQQ